MSNDNADNTTRKQQADVLRENGFKSGQSGNPAGRPKGARNKLSEAFLDALFVDWTEHGADVIAKVRETKPEQYLKVVASLMPRELNVKVNDLDELTDDQLRHQYAAIAAALDASGLAPVGAPESAEVSDVEPLQTLQ
jgi:hypothetical protein